VWGRLVPCLRAGGAHVLIDRERFVAGRAIVGQMDSLQDEADRHLLVLSAEYHASPMCTHEMERAIALDPTFGRGVVMPVLRDDTAIPAIIRRSDPLWIDMRDDTSVEQWQRLLVGCCDSLGVSAPEWLSVRDQLESYLARGESVNLVVSGKVRWHTLVEEVARHHVPEIPILDLHDPETFSRRGLISAILARLGSTLNTSQHADDLLCLSRCLSQLRRSTVALLHFDMVKMRGDEWLDFFAALHHFTMNKRQLVLLIESREPFSSLMPEHIPFSRLHPKTILMRETRL